jgi:hypothetical protein
MKTLICSLIVGWLSTSALAQPTIIIQDTDYAVALRSPSGIEVSLTFNGQSPQNLVLSQAKLLDEVRQLDIDINELKELQNCHYSWEIERDYDDVFSAEAVKTHRGSCELIDEAITIISPVRVTKFFLVFEEAAFTRHSAITLKYLPQASDAEGRSFHSRTVVPHFRSAPVFARIQLLSLRGVIASVSTQVHWLTESGWIEGETVELSDEKTVFN